VAGGLQAEATALAQPQLEGADIDCDFKGLDVLPIAAALERGSAAKAQRLKLNGRTKFSVRLVPTGERNLLCPWPIKSLLISILIHHVLHVLKYAIPCLA
jgi:hypothetical protein